MALTERTRPYETLIRHNDNGTIGAHHVTINEVLRNGVVINATMNPPTPVDGAALSDILGADLAVALAYIPQLEAQVANLSQRLEQALQQLQSAHHDIASRDEQIAQQASELEALQAAAGALAGRMEELQSVVASLQGEGQVAELSQSSAAAST